MRKKILILLILFSILISGFLFAENNFVDSNFNDNNLNFIENNSFLEDYVCGVYFTGIGCPHCADIDPYLFKNSNLKNKNLIIIEYEVKVKKENTNLAIFYDQIYESGFEIPFLIIDKNNTYYYDSIVNNFLNKDFNNIKENNCPFPVSVYEDGAISFNNLNLNKLKGSPVIWFKDRALEKVDGRFIDSNLLKSLLIDQNIDNLFKSIDYNNLKNKYLFISGEVVFFDNAISLNGWNFYFNGAYNILNKNDNITNNSKNDMGIFNKLNLTKLLLLLLSCILILVLIFFILQNQLKIKKRKVEKTKIRKKQKN